MDLTRFEEKLNKVDGNVYVIEERVQLKEGVYNGELKHDNISPTTLAIYTGPRLTGERIQSYTISTPSLTPWKRVIKVFADVPEVYISYETDGDTVEAEDINRLQEATTRTQAAVNEEAERASGAERGLKESLDAESQRAKDTEVELADRINEERGRAQTAERALRSDLTSEVERATSAETALSKRLSDETVRAQAAEGVLTENLAAEVARAEGAEQVLTNALAAEEVRAEAAEKVLTDHLATEVLRAKAAEKANADGLATESTRAKGAEKTLTDNLATETARAKAAEKANGDAIAAERSRATAAEQGLNTDLSSHKANTSNPHKVTKAQVGLGNVTNESKTTMFTSPKFTGIPTAPSASAETNTDQIATAKFVQEAIGRGIAASDALIFKGTLGEGGTITALPTTYRTGWTYRVISSGRYAGAVCEPGDLITALIGRSGSGNLDTDWTVSQTNIDGAVVSTRKINAGNGLTGGGDLAYDRTFHVGAGNGIAVAADSIAVKPNTTGTAGSVGKIVVDGNGVGAALGTTSTTAFRGDQGKTAYDHSQAAHARTDATKVEVSTTNGNIKINGTETSVYRHPDGTNPHGTTKVDVGLGNVPNVTTNDQAVTYTQATTLANLSSGEKLSVAMGKLAKAVADLIAHIGDAVKHITADERTKWNAVTNKVDKVSGKQLSTNDYTTAEKNKLAGIAAGAEVNVQVDWKATDTASDAYIKNKPTSMPASDVSAWAKAAAKPSYGWTEITGKPSTFTPAAHTHTKGQITDMPTKVSQFTNDAGYLKSSDIDTSQNHTHANKAILDKITQALLDNWNAAFSHISSKNNPHGVTAAQVGAASSSHTHAKSQITDFPSSMPASDVPAWAKAASKPSYGWTEITGKPSTFSPASHSHSNLTATNITGQTVDVNNYNLSSGSPQIQLYSEKTSGGAANITNIPVTGQPFLLKVESLRWASATDYITKQTFLSATAKTTYERYCTNGTWGSWLPTAVFNAKPVSGRVLVSDGTSGGIKASAYTIAASVPAGAKFTDTVYNHPNSGVAAGTYRSVTVNAQGHVTAGSNPTTLAGYGIKDAAAKNHNHDGAYMPMGPFTWAQMHGSYTWNQLKGV